MIRVVTAKLLSMESQTPNKGDAHWVDASQKSTKVRTELNLLA